VKAFLAGVYEIIAVVWLRLGKFKLQWLWFWLGGWLVGLGIPKMNIICFYSHFPPFYLVMRTKTQPFSTKSLKGHQYDNLNSHQTRITVDVNQEYYNA
jgi:hypothetical protein